MEGVTMSRKELNQVELFAQLKVGGVTKKTVAAKLGLSLRQVKRKWKAYRERGPAGLVHGLRGKPGNRSVGSAMTQAVALVEAKYRDFGPTFAAEKLRERDGLVVNHETLRLHLIAAELWVPRQHRRVEIHEWRQRRAVRGELVQADGSPHHWFEDRAEPCTLLQFIDDATSEVLWLEFVASESAHDVMHATRHYLEAAGRPGALYVDRGGVFKVNLGNSDDERQTQYERALGELDIQLIHARSPQAKGRVERGFQTHQDRLVKELRLEGITTMAEANRYLRDVYLPKHNRKFAVPARQSGDAHRSLAGYDLDAILCTKELRLVGNDRTIRYRGRWFQLEARQPTIVRPKTMVTVAEHLDGRISLHLRQTTLNWRALPARPMRPSQAPAIRTMCPPWKPPANHPWRTYPVTVLSCIKG